MATRGVHSSIGTLRILLVGFMVTTLLYYPRTFSLDLETFIFSSSFFFFLSSSIWVVPLASFFLPAVSTDPSPLFPSDDGSIPLFYSKSIFPFSASSFFLC
jgi:hypothetical protein